MLTDLGVDRKNEDGNDAGALTRLAWYLRDSTPCSKDLIAEI